MLSLTPRPQKAAQHPSDRFGDPIVIPIPSVDFRYVRRVLNEMKIREGRIYDVPIDQYAELRGLSIEKAVPEYVALCVAALVKEVRTARTDFDAEARRRGYVPAAELERHVAERVEEQQRRNLPPDMPAGGWYHPPEVRDPQGGLYRPMPVRIPPSDPVEREKHETRKRIRNAMDRDILRIIEARPSSVAVHSTGKSLSEMAKESAETRRINAEAALLEAQREAMKTRDTGNLFGEESRTRALRARAVDQLERRGDFERAFRLSREPVSVF